VYATSNRRDLTIEKLQDEKFPEYSLNDAYALVDRFGLRLGFWGFSKEQYINIVKHYVKSLNLTWNEEFEEEADRFALNAGGYSGRSAKQFVKYLTVNLCYNKNHG
jgi:predicted AAA+ superfamily ATPase